MIRRIKVKDYISCNVCKEYDDVEEIRFMSSVSCQGIAVNLCKGCRKELIDVLKQKDMEDDQDAKKGGSSEDEVHGRSKNG